MAKKNEVATVEGFNLVTVDPEAAAAAREEMDGLGIVPYDFVKIPPGGVTAFEIPGETEEETESAKELVGVILYHHPVNVFWADSFSGGGVAPDCSANDGKKGVDRETGVITDCASCPKNQFGSAGRGKACKNIHRIYILRDGSPVPLILPLPPTSLTAMRNYIGKRIVARGLRSYDVVTKITLKKEKNSENIAYSKAVFEQVGVLSDEQRAQAAAMAKVLKEQNVPVSDLDYAAEAEATSADQGFTNVPEGSQEALPFQ